MVEAVPLWGKVVLALTGAAIVAVAALQIVDDSPPAPLPADWHVDADADVAATTTRIPVLVREQSCASGRTADGRVEAVVHYGPTVVSIDIGVRPLGGDQDCQSNPETPFSVDLREPLGDRRIEGERWSAA